MYLEFQSLAHELGSGRQTVLEPRYLKIYDADINLSHWMFFGYCFIQRVSSCTVASLVPRPIPRFSILHPHS